MVPQTKTKRTALLMGKGQSTRVQILEAACRLFSERGYDGAGIRDIEASANVNRGVATYHFRNKETLWKAAVEHTFAPYLAELEDKKELLCALEPEPRMKQVIRQFVRMSAERPYLNQLMIQESLAKTWRIKWIIKRYLKPVQALRREIFDGDEAGAALNDNPHLHYAFIGACALVFSLQAEAKALYQVDPFDEDFVENHIETLTALFVGRTVLKGNKKGGIA